MTSTLKAQPLDCIQYFYTKVHDPAIRAKICFDGKIDVEILRRTIDTVLTVVPEAGCSFDSHRHAFLKKDFDSDDILTIPDIDDNEEKLMLSSPDIEKEPLLAVYLLEGEEKDSLIVVVSHILCDGGGFKELLTLIASVYSDLSSGRKPVLPKKIDRSFEKIAKNPENLKVKAKKANETASIHQDESMFFEFDGRNPNPFYVRSTFTKEETAAVKNYAKAHGATFNDAVMAAYARVLCRKLHIGIVAFPCPTDIRKFSAEPQALSVCNLTSNYGVVTSCCKFDDFAVTLKDIARQMKKQKASLGCLKGIFLLHKIFKLAPISLIEKLFHKLSPIPVTSYTNLGVLKNESLKFGELETTDAFIVTAVKQKPYFQLSVSTFNGVCSLTSAFCGNDGDKKKIEDILESIKAELLTALK